MSILKFAPGSMEEALAQLLAVLQPLSEPSSPNWMRETSAHLLAGLPPPPKSTILRLPVVLHERGDRSRSAHYKDIKDGLFTPPVSIGARAVGWPAREVAVLNAARIAGKTDDEIRAVVATLIVARRQKLLGGGNEQ